MDYFAINCDLEDLMNKVDTYYLQLSEIGHTSKIQNSYYYYYGQGMRSSFLHRGGLQGQTTNIVINDYQAILRHMTTLVTSNKTSYDVRATNTDYKSQAQTILGEQILEYYLREKQLDKILKKACGYGIKYSEGFIGLDWDVTLGSIIGATEDGRPINEGDIQYSVYHPLQVVRDIYNTRDQEWVIIVTTKSKYELAAKYPEYSEHILNLSNNSYDASIRNIDYLLEGRLKQDTDVIPFYTFYHRKSAVLPEGRIAFFVEGKKLQDGVLPYQDIPVYRLAPDHFDGTCLGYTSAWDLLGIQYASDKLYSAVVSNNMTFSRQVVQTSRDNDINVSELADGIMLVESEAELKPVNLTKSAPETYNLIQMLGGKQNELSGMNEVVRGTPSPNLRSGNSLAIIAAQAITFNSGIESEYIGLIEDVGTATLRILKEYANSPRFAAVVGKYKKAYMKEFSSQDLVNIDRATVDVQGSVMRTTAGKVQLAENLLQNGVITRADQYLMVLETGKLDPLVEAEQSELLLIKNENEMMAEGKTPNAVAIDDHDLHIKEHKSVVSTPESRANPSVIEATLSHISDHIQLKKTVDPEILALVGVQPIQPAPQVSRNREGQLPVNEMQAPQALLPENQPKLPNLPKQADEVSQQSYDRLLNMQQP